MAKPAARIAVVQVGLALGLLAVIARAAQLQIVEHDRWAAEAAANRTATKELPARRGTIYDRRGVALAVTQEFYHFGVAVDQIHDRDAVVKAVAAVVGEPESQVRRELRAVKRYKHYQGPYSATQVERLRELRGVHLQSEFRRFYRYEDLARPIVGHLVSDSVRGAAGLELALDSVLSGVPGEAVVLVDRREQRYESPSRHVRDPVAGHDVRLTLDAEMQAIAERTLDEALADAEAEGGDVVFLDPRTGELLALASRQAGTRSSTSSRASVFTDSYQPGSTAKLFTAAALLMLNRVDSTDEVHGENGSWRMPVTETQFWTISDSERHDGMLTLEHTIGVSSNIGIVKFAHLLTDGEQFDMLRAFGFGSPTGVEFPSESRGTLRLPARWNPRYTRFSQAMGYEFTVTPVQLAAAYGAIANGGILLSPTLVREVRDANGRLVYQHRPEPVRRVVSEQVAARLRRFLHEASSTEGTGSRAQLAGYELLGKTGTARMVRDGSYGTGDHTASYAAIFPADDPQLVVVVKIDAPRKGGYYGGLIAAPAVKRMLQQVLTSEQIALDRTRLVAQPAPRAPDPLGGTVPASLPVAVVSWPPAGTATDPGASTPVPPVTDSALRPAVRALHAAEFRVRLRGTGTTVVRTEPAAGQPLSPGSTVTVWTDE